MPELVMTSWPGRALAALVIACAATYGSCRPVETAGSPIALPSVPALQLPMGRAIAGLPTVNESGRA